MHYQYIAVNYFDTASSRIKLTFFFCLQNAAHERIEKKLISYQKKKMNRYFR